MPRIALAIALPLVVAVGGGGLLWHWWTGGSAGIAALRLPGMDAEPPAAGAGANPAAAGRLQTGPGRPLEAIAPEDHAWPRFRGPQGDGVARPGVPLAREWPAGGPRVLWSIEMGEGYAAPVVAHGRAYVLDYDAKAQADVLRCLSLADGRDIWRYAYPVKVKRNHGMSRTVAALKDRYLVSLGPKCHVVCLDALDGRLLWSHDLVGEFKATVPEWYAGQCPLIDGDRAILATGAPGPSLLAAVELAGGEVAWQSPNPRGWKQTHASVVRLDVDGVGMYVVCGSGGVAGVSVEDGSILWDLTDWKISIATVPTPVVLPGGRVFLSGGYDAGCLLLEVRRQGGGWEARVLDRQPARVFGATQTTPIWWQDRIWGVRPDGCFACLQIDDGIRVAWTSPTTTNFGLGPYLIADGLLYVMDDHGLLVLAEASTEGWRELARAKVLPGPEAWGPMALAGGRLLLRDMRRLACVWVGQGDGPGAAPP